MARGNFGERLKREREMREVSLKEVTVATRIGSRFLEALENEDWARLPGGVFNRGFVRSIARYLGLDEEDLLAEYDEARGEQAAEAPPTVENRIPSPPKWIFAVTALAIVLILAGLIVAGVYGWRRYSAHRRAKQAAVLLQLNSYPTRSRPQASSPATMIESR
jgi:cytoskeleton protein RodZ